MAHPNLNTTDPAKDLSSDLVDSPESTEEPGQPTIAPFERERSSQERSRLGQPVQSEMTSPVPMYDTDRYRLVRPFTTRL